MTENRENIDGFYTHRYGGSQKIDVDNAQANAVNEYRTAINALIYMVNAKHSDFNTQTTKVSELNTGINTNINGVNASNITMD